MADCQKNKKIKIGIIGFLVLLILAILSIFISNHFFGREVILRNSQVYHDSLKNLQSDKKTLIILLDGFGYYQYKDALKGGYIPFLGTLANPKEAETYFPSISPVGLAAMVTGVGPEKNGIKERQDKEIAVTDIFQQSKDLGKKAVYIEGDIKLINTSMEPILNADKNDDGYTDEEVFECAKEVMQNSYDLVFIHFHGIDDVSHEYNPKSKEALVKTKQIDGYLREIVSQWDGNIIITADHGQHETEEGGKHGTTSAEDMKVPYIYIEG